MKLAPSYCSAIAEDHRTTTFVALLAGFMEVSEPFEERDDAEAIRDQHPTLLPRALVAMRKLALMREDKKATLKPWKPARQDATILVPAAQAKSTSAAAPHFEPASTPPSVGAYVDTV